MESNKKLFKRILHIVSKIPIGKVLTYGKIADIIGIKDARKIGWALNHSSSDSICPCHRVVNKEGKLAPGYVFGGPDEQKLRLLSEGVIFKNDDTVDLDKCLWNA